MATPSPLPSAPGLDSPLPLAEIDDQRLRVLLESLLFVAGEPAPVARLAAAVNVPVERVESALDALEQDLQARGIRVQRHRQAVQLVSAPEAAEVIETYLGLDLSSKLSRAALETLAIIAYRQPVTRPQVEAVRGVNSDAVLRTLLNRGVIEEVGRLEQAGRPILYGTTFAFLQYFGIQSLADLPPLDENMLAEVSARLEALAEGQPAGAESAGQG